jgi:MOSC domain-containing protein YiiM
MAKLRVIALYIKPHSGVPSTPMPALELRPEFGIAGDHHTGPMRVRSTGEVVSNVRHFTAVTPQELGAAAESLGVPYIDPAWIGANICFAYEGPQPFTASMREGTRLYNSAGRAVLEVKGETEPCLDAGKMIAAQFPDLNVPATLFPKCAIGQRGVYGIVLEEAVVRLGDVLTAVVSRG